MFQFGVMKEEGIAVRTVMFSCSEGTEFLRYWRPPWLSKPVYKQRSKVKRFVWDVWYFLCSTSHKNPCFRPPSVYWLIHVSWLIQYTQFSTNFSFLIINVSSVGANQMDFFIIFIKQLRWNLCRCLWIFRILHLAFSNFRLVLIYYCCCMQATLYLKSVSNGISGSQSIKGIADIH